MLKILIPLALGVASVLQGGMNRKVGADLGVPKATLMNNVVLLGASLIFYVLTRPSGNTSPVVKPSSLSMLIPGLLGMCLVAGIPWAISKWGATIVFVGLIFSQLTASLLWDITIENKSANLYQVVGILTSMVGAILVNVRA